MRFQSCLMVLLACINAQRAGAGDFAERCSELAREAQIAVAFQDGPVATDESRTVQALNEMAGKHAGGNHYVYGLTHATPHFRLSASARTVADERGRICAMPDISVSLGFSEIVVYLARELTNRCRRNVIREHEDEHVNTWKNHLRASAQLLQTALRREVGGPRQYASRDEAEAGIRAWAEQLVTPWANKVIAAVREAQQAIDTPASYAMVAGRLRACPGGSR